MITKVLNSQSYIDKTVPVGTSFTSFAAKWGMPIMSVVMNTQSGKQVDYVEAFVKVTGTMPANSTVTAQFYREGKLLLTSTSGALGAYTNTSFTQRFACLPIYDEVVITVNSKQTTTAYVVDVILTALEKIVNDHVIDSPVDDVSFQLGASVASPGNIDSTITFLDSQGAAVTEKVNCIVYTSSDAGGSTPDSAATTFSATAGDLLQLLTTRQMYIAQSTAAGLLTIRLNDAAGTLYLNVLINGKKFTSGAITWT